MISTDCAILLTIADQRMRIAALEMENAELRSTLETMSASVENLRDN